MTIDRHKVLVLSLPLICLQVSFSFLDILFHNMLSGNFVLQLIDFLSMSAQNLVQANISFPRFFFQQLQSTNVKV